jgi:ribonuclease R
MLKEKVLVHILEKSYQAKNVNDLAGFFEVPTTTMDELINDLIESGDVVLSKKEKVLTPAMANMLVGIIMINAKGFGFLVTEELDDDVFIPSPYVNTAMHKDKVLVVKHKDKDEIIGEVVKVLKRAKTQLIGTVKIKNKKTYLASLDTRISDWIPLKSNKNQKIHRGYMVVADIESYKPLVARYSHSLGQANAPQVDIKALLLDNDITLEFTPEVLNEAQRVLNKKDTAKRVDLSDQNIFTIDGEDAKDLDDAISINRTETGYELGVHIADVSFYVEENKPIDLEAKERGTSVYATDVVVPMLPEALSNDVCSLTQGKPRYTISCTMQISKHGKIVSSKIFPSIIESKQRFSYTQVNDIIHGDDFDDALEPFKETILLAQECAKIMQKHRSKQGDLDFVSQESAFIMDHGTVLDVQARYQQEAEELIESFMVAANESVAYTMKIQSIPAIYRVHEKPDPEKIRDLAKMLGLFGYPLKADANKIHQNQLQKALAFFKGTNFEPVVNMIALRSMKKATYESTPIGHYGLALEDYLHFTSPIRRYPDLIVHRMIRRYLFEHELDLEKIKIDHKRNTEFAQMSSNNERKAIDAERSVQDMKKAEFMTQVIGEIYEGIISGVTGFGFFVSLTNTIEGLVHIQSLKDDYYRFDASYFRLVGQSNKKVFALGDKVLVKVKDADKERRQIDFTYLKHLTPEKKDKPKSGDKK